MFIHQEANNNIREGWIDLDKISYINKYDEYSDGTVIYKCYLIGDDSPITIFQETFDKIIAERGVV